MVSHDESHEMEQAVSHIPCKDNQNWSHRNFADEALEPFLGLAFSILQSILTNLNEIVGTFYSRCN